MDQIMDGRVSELPEFIALATAEDRLSFLTGISQEERSTSRSPFLSLESYPNGDWRLALLSLIVVVNSPVFESCGTGLTLHQVEALEKNLAQTSPGSLARAIRLEVKWVEVQISQCEHQLSVSQGKARKVLSLANWNQDQTRQYCDFKQSTPLAEHPQLSGVLMSFLNPSDLMNGIRVANQTLRRAVDGYLTEASVDHVVSLMWETEGNNASDQRSSVSLSLFQGAELLRLLHKMPEYHRGFLEAVFHRLDISADSDGASHCALLQPQEVIFSSSEIIGSKPASWDSPVSLESAKHIYLQYPYKSGKEAPSAVTGRTVRTKYSGLGNHSIVQRLQFLHVHLVPCRTDLQHVTKPSSTQRTRHSPCAPFIEVVFSNGYHSGKLPAVVVSATPWVDFSPMVLRLSQLPSASRKMDVCNGAEGEGAHDEDSKSVCGVGGLTQVTRCVDVTALSLCHGMRDETRSSNAEQIVAQAREILSLGKRCVLQTEAPANGDPPLHHMPPQPEVQSKYQVGDRVKAFWKSMTRMTFSGTITQVLPSMEEYSIRFDDGDFEPCSPESKIQELISHAPQTGHAPQKTRNGDSKYQVGDRVKATWKSGSRVYPGRITKVLPSVKGPALHEYSIQFDDGDFEPCSPESRIQEVTSHATPPHATFSPGDAVLAPWKKMTQLFRGTVQRDNGDGTYAIKFADGDFEPKQKGSTMRRN